MGAFIIRRLAQTVVVLIFVSVLAFLLIQIMPGDPAALMLGPNASEEQIQLLRHELWLDRSLPTQYFHWFRNLLHGDLGKSIAHGVSVTQLITRRVPVTFHIGLLALVISSLVSIPAGVIAATKRGRFLDSVVTLWANFGMAVPIFWLGIIGVYVFALKLNWLPVQGYAPPLDNFWLNTKQIIMPVLCLAVTPLAILTRQTRSSMLEVIRQDYIRTARSKGLQKRTVIFGHALKNAIIPMVTLIGINLRNLVGGSILVETVFNIPGMGSLMVNAVFNKDFTVVQGCIIVVAVVVAIANLAVDISYGYFDPRIRYDE